MKPDRKQQIISVLIIGVLSTLAATAGPQTGAQAPPGAAAKKPDPSPPASSLERVPPEKLREDFRILRGALEEGHPGIYRYTPKAELDKRFDQA